MADRPGRVRGGQGHRPVGTRILTRAIAVGLEGLRGQHHDHHQADGQADARDDEHLPQPAHPVGAHGAVQAPGASPSD